MNNQLYSAIQLRRTNCGIPGTAEYDNLKRRNKDVTAHNTQVTLNKEGTIKRHLTAARLYPFEELKQSDDKGGLNFVWYAFEVLPKHLFPCFEAIQQNNKDRHVVIIEDNDPSHLKARRLLAAEITTRNIEFAPPQEPHLTSTK